MYQYLCSHLCSSTKGKELKMLKGEKLLQRKKVRFPLLPHNPQRLLTLSPRLPAETTKFK